MKTQFVIMSNDYPVAVCPEGTSGDAAREKAWQMRDKWIKERQDYGNWEPFFHVKEVEVIEV